MWWDKYVGAPFEDKGMGPHNFNCWGLYRWVQEYDNPRRLILPTYEHLYESSNDRDKLAAIIKAEKQIKWQAVEKPLEFDAILIRMSGVPMHIGVVTKKGHMLHCCHGVGTTHERFDLMRWRDKVLGFYRHE